MLYFIDLHADDISQESYIEIEERAFVQAVATRINFIPTLHYHDYVSIPDRYENVVSKEPVGQGHLRVTEYR